LNSSFEAAWYSTGAGISYVFKLIDEDNHTVFIKETKDTSLALDLNQLGLLKNIPYTWYVYSTGMDKSKSDICTFRLLGESNIKTIADSINDVKKNLDINSAVDQFILVKFLESKNLNCDALKGFDNILKSYPGIEDYKYNYIAFLLKQNITRKAETLLPTNN
jgi:2-hydroxy-3-keto-5-methylthiopentenyl-1-phosphate phosphatase